MRLSVDSRPRRIHVSANPEIITVGELCAWLGVSAMWITRYTRAHGFPRGFQLGGKTSARRWYRADVEAWLKRRARQSAASAEGEVYMLKRRAKQSESRS